ncbi:hypothetical protein D3C81_1678150 [compost metagenome]
MDLLAVLQQSLKFPVRHRAYRFYFGYIEDGRFGSSEEVALLIFRFQLIELQPGLIHLLPAVNKHFVIHRLKIKNITRIKHVHLQIRHTDQLFGGCFYGINKL